MFSCLLFRVQLMVQLEKVVLLFYSCIILLMKVLSMLFWKILFRLVIRCVRLCVLYYFRVCWLMLIMWICMVQVWVWLGFMDRQLCRLVMLLVCYWLNRCFRLLQFFFYKEMGVRLKVFCLERVGMEVGMEWVREDLFCMIFYFLLMMKCNSFMEIFVVFLLFVYFVLCNFIV